MNLTIAPRSVLQIDNARIIFRNFAGRGDKYKETVTLRLSSKTRISLTTLLQMAGM